MPRIGVSITKAVAFRGATQEFSNVYYYEVLNLPNSTEAEEFIDKLTTLEKTFHSVTVQFVKGRCWSQIGTKDQNNMIHQKNLSGTGARSGGTAIDPERAYLFRLRAGNDSRATRFIFESGITHTALLWAPAYLPTHTLRSNSRSPRLNATPRLRRCKR